MKKKNIVIPYLCLINFLSLTTCVILKKDFYIDKIGYQLVTYFLKHIDINIVKILTQLGSGICLISITLIILLKKKKEGLFVSANLINITLLNVLLKNILKRPRPSEHILIKENGYSFPSGHAMVSTAFYGYLIYLINKNVKNTQIKFALNITLILIIFIIGISRIYLGVHYTTDVLGGILIAIFYVTIFIKTTSNVNIDRQK